MTAAVIDAAGHRGRLRWLACAAATSALAGCGGGVLDPRGPIGQANRTILLDSLAIMLAIVVPTILATLAIAWWYRASNRRARYLPDWEFSGSIELVVWFIPFLTIILLGGVTWIGSYQLDPWRPVPGKGAAIDIQVVSLDWKWLFIYPDERIATVNQIVVPVGFPLHFTLTSSSVMNTFFVPQLGSMIYTMNGMATQLNLRADHPGTYRGLSGHFSGDGFSGMHFDVRAVATEDYESWVASVRRGGGVLDDARYTALARQSLDVPPETFGDAAPNLFDRIVSQRLPPGPGPEETSHAQPAKKAGS
jgi:cytochrome o ubiquinol oxidase subunit II